MTRERYDLLVELVQELDQAVEAVRLRGVDDLSPYTTVTDNFDIDSTSFTLRGTEPWQYGDPVSSYVPASFVIDEEREAAFAKQAQDRLDAARLKQEKEDKEVQDQRERDLKRLASLREQYPDA